MAELLPLWRRKLELSGFHVTRQRAIVMGVIASHPGDASISDVCTMVRAIDEMIAPRTITSIVQLFIDLEIVIATAGRDGSIRVTAVQPTSYQRLACRNCGHVFDLPSLLREAIYREVLTGGNFLVEDAQIVISGVCERCRKASLF